MTIRLKKIWNYFGKLEKALWLLSVTLITVSFFVFDGVNVLNFIASLIGVTSLIFCAKGNPMGQALVIVFSVLYGIISFGFSYYGEMITYLGMTAPMAIASLVSWVRHPYNGDKSQVRVNRLNARDIAVMAALTAAVTVMFYFILKFFNTANLIPGTVSVTTSFLAVFLTYKRSPYYAVAYAANDIVLIVLWVLAARSDASYYSVVSCFAAFLANDVYGFVSWRKMRKAQEQNAA